MISYRQADLIDAIKKRLHLGKIIVMLDGGFSASPIIHTDGTKLQLNDQTIDANDFQVVASSSKFLYLLHKQNTPHLMEWPLCTQEDRNDDGSWFGGDNFGKIVDIREDGDITTSNGNKFNMKQWFFHFVPLYQKIMIRRRDATTYPYAAASLGITSYRQADLLNTSKRPLVPVEVALCIAANADRNGPARVDGKMYATTVLTWPERFEEILTLVEGAIGHRIKDRIWSKEGESFVDFGNRLRFVLEQDFESISSTPIKIKKSTESGICCFTFKFSMRMK